LPWPSAGVAVGPFCSAVVNFNFRRRRREHVSGYHRSAHGAWPRLKDSSKDSSGRPAAAAAFASAICGSHGAAPGLRVEQSKVA
jgi:hypothetical protein